MKVFDLFPRFPSVIRNESIPIAKLSLLLGANGSGKTTIINDIEECLGQKGIFTSATGELGPALLMDLGDASSEVLRTAAALYLRQAFNETSGLTWAKFKDVSWAALLSPELDRFAVLPEFTIDAIYFREIITDFLIMEDQAIKPGSQPQEVAEEVASRLMISYREGRIGIAVDASDFYFDDFGDDMEDWERDSTFGLSELRKLIGIMNEMNDGFAWLYDPSPQNRLGERVDAEIPYGGIGRAHGVLYPLRLEYDDRTFLGEIEVGLTNIAHRMYWDRDQRIETMKLAKESFRQRPTVDDFSSWFLDDTTPFGFKIDSRDGDRVNPLIEEAIKLVNGFAVSLLPSFLTEEGLFELALLPRSQWHAGRPRIDLVLHQFEQQISIENCSSGLARYAALTFRLATELALQSEPEGENLPLVEPIRVLDLTQAEIPSSDSARSQEIVEMLRSFSKLADASPNELEHLRRLVFEANIVPSGPAIDDEYARLRLSLMLESSDGYSGLVEALNRHASKLKKVTVMPGTLDELDEGLSNREKYLRRLDRGTDGFLPARIYRKNPLNAVLLLDEPEVHLHPFAVRSARDWIELIHPLFFAVVIATHSQVIADVDLPASQTLIAERVHGGSFFLPIGVDMTRDNEILLGQLGLTKGEIFLRYRYFLFVEGIHDKIVLETLFADELDSAGIRLINLQGLKNARHLATEDLIWDFGKPIGVFADNHDGNKDLGKGSGLKTGEDGEIRKAISHFEAAGKQFDRFGHNKKDILFQLDSSIAKTFANSRFSTWSAAYEAATQSGRQSDWKKFMKSEYGLNIEGEGSLDVIRQLATIVRLNGLIPDELVDEVFKVRARALNLT
jgi:hypothetical protein